MPIKLGNSIVNDLVIIGSDGNAKQCVSIDINSTSQNISPPTPAAILNQDGLSSNFSIKYIKDGTETSFKTTSSTSGTLSNADLFNLRKNSPDAIIVESSSGTLDKDGKSTNFKNYYPFNNSKFSIGKKIVASPISSIQYFMKSEGSSDSEITSKISGIFNININSLFDSSGNDTIIDNPDTINDVKQLEKRIQALTEASKVAISGSTTETILSAVAKQIIAETSNLQSAETFFNNQTENILVSVQKDVSSIDPSTDLDPSTAARITTISTNTKNIMDKDIEAYEDGNKTQSSTFVKNLLEEESIEIDSSTDTFSSNIDSAVTSVLQDILDTDYVTPSG